MKKTMKKTMSKYNPLWTYIQEQSGQTLLLSFAEIETICGLPIDHSFLQYKKELAGREDLHETADSPFPEKWAENIMPVQNVRDLVKKRGSISCLADELTLIGKCL